MISRLHFSQRIAMAFVLMTVVVSGAFSLGIVGVVHFVEEQLISRELLTRLNMVLHEDVRVGRPPRLDARTRFFASDDPQRQIPERYAALPDGLTEIEEGNEAAYVYLLQRNGVRYMLVQDQREFEDREEILFAVVVAGFLLCIVGAWGLSVVMARQVMAPVARLAGQVEHLERRDAPDGPLAPGYPDDEVGRLASAFDSALGQLRLAIERERLFTSDVSHELRTPLMVISTSCELLEELSLDDRQREQVERIGRSAREMKELVQTFLLLARAEDIGVEEGLAPTVAEIAHEQGERWAGAIREKGLKFRMVEEGSAQIVRNPTFVRTVMSNLLRNALHYTSAGEVRLVLEDSGFRIEDTGMGIEADEQERIFQPFRRGAKARGEGLGLGLSLVKRICEQQDWGITVREMQPHGSCFGVSFSPGPGDVPHMMPK
jgi:signal transduction histidine kinase